MAENNTLSFLTLLPKELPHSKITVHRKESIIYMYNQ